MAYEHAEFFNKLPSDRLIPLEIALRDVIMDWLRIERGSFPIGEWIDRRIGSEVECIIVDGMPELKLRGQGSNGPSKKYGKDNHWQSSVPTQHPEGGHYDRGTKREQPDEWGQGKKMTKPAFIKSLPPDHLTNDEAALKASVMKAMRELPKTNQGENMQCSIYDVTGRTDVKRAVRKLLPVDNLHWLLYWLKARMRDDVRVVQYGTGEHFLCLTEHAAMPSKKGEKFNPEETHPHDKFIDELPKDELTDAEAALREALLDQLTGVACVELKDLRARFGFTPWMSGAKCDKELNKLLVAVFPGADLWKLGQPLVRWASARMGAEVELTTTVDGKKAMRLTGLSGDEAGDGNDSSGASAKDHGNVGGLSAADLFETFPADDFLSQEETLREVLLRLLEEANEPVRTATLLRNKDIKGLCDDLFEGSRATLSDWCERRINAEVQIRGQGNAETLMLAGKEYDSRKKRRY